MNKINKNREKKEKIVAELSEKVKKAKALVFANYTGMTHVQLEQLKKAVKKVDAELVVTKNTLLERSLQDQRSILRQSSGQAIKDQSLQGPTATLFAYEDVISPLKELAKTIKLLKLPLIKFGIFSGEARPGSAWEVLTETEIMRLSALPSREVLLYQLVFTLKSPIYGLHRALSWNLRQLVVILKAIEQKK